MRFRKQSTKTKKKPIKGLWHAYGFRGKRKWTAE